MPRLWTDTIEEHRRAVREAALDAAAALAAERGVRSVTMSEVAKRAGVGRATLYKYFEDVDAVLHAWHERQVHEHVRHLAEIGARGGDADERLEAVLEAYASMAHGHPGTALAALLHEGEHVAQARRHLGDFLRGLMVEGAATGRLRGDVPPDELASYCLHALAGAGELRSKAAVRRLVQVTLAGLRPRS